MGSRDARRRSKLAALAALEIGALAAFGVALSHAASAAPAEPTEPAVRPTATLEQCANGPAPASRTDGCGADAQQWRPADLGAGEASYREGDAIPYRLRFQGLAPGTGHQVTIEWSTVVDGVHAIDRLAAVDATVSAANPCAGIDGCDPSRPSPLPAPLSVEPAIGSSADGPTPAAVAMYGATVTGARLTTLDAVTRLTVTFDAAGPEPVLAWGAHVATRSDWGATGTAMNLPGAPYRTGLVELDGVAADQRLAVAADAVSFPGSITVIAEATPPGPTPFSFTASPAPLGPVTLIDDGSSAATATFADLVAFTTYTIAQNATPGWSIGPISCTVADANGGTRRIDSSSVAIDLREGEHVSCRFASRQQLAHLGLKAEVANEHGGTATAGGFELIADGPTPLSGPGAVEGDVRPGTYDLATTAVAGYDVGPWTCTAGTLQGSVLSLAEGDDATCTVRAADRSAHLQLIKTVRNTNGGTATAAGFLLIAGGPTPATGAGSVDLEVDAGTYTLFTTTLPGYDEEPWSCTGGTLVGSQLVLDLGQSAVCTSVSHDLPVPPAA